MNSTSISSFLLSAPSRWRRSVLALALPLALVACGGSDDPEDMPGMADASTEPDSGNEPDSGEDPGVTCPEGTDVEELLAQSCTGGACHSAAAMVADLDLVSPGVAERLVGVEGTQNCDNQILVVAGDPDASLLVDKIGPSPSCGERMPFRQTPLSEEEITCVRDWIAGMSAAR